MLRVVHVCRRSVSDLRNGWLIKTRRKSFAVYAATSSEKKEWMQHIQRCIEDLVSKSKSHKSARDSDHIDLLVLLGYKLRRLLGRI